MHMVHAAARCAAAQVLSIVYCIYSKHGDFFAMIVCVKGFQRNLMAPVS